MATAAVGSRAGEDLPRLADPAITIDGVDFQKPTASDGTRYWNIRMTPTIHCVAGHGVTFGRALYKNSATAFKQGWSYYAANKGNFSYLYPPVHPKYYSRSFLQEKLSATIRDLNGLIVATVPSYCSQLLGGNLLLREGFKRLDICSHNPNHDMTGHWIHLFWKFQGDAKLAGVWTPTGDNLLNCCGANAYDRRSTGVITRDRTRLAFMLLPPDKTLSESAILIHKFEDAQVVAIPGDNNQPCPHKFTIREALADLDAEEDDD